MKHLACCALLAACSVDVAYQTGPQRYLCGDSEKCPGGKICVQGLCCATACEREAETTCGQSGECKSDGTGCALYDPSITCTPAVCSNGQLAPAQTCNGEGLCQPQTPMACPSHFACADSTSCKTSCQGNQDCATGFFCQGGACQPKTQNGDGCTSGADCASGTCVANLCCASNCADQGACGTNGLCESSGPNKGTCQLYPAGAICSPERCTDSPGGGQFTAPQFCPGGGAACPNPGPTTCAAKVACSGSTCIGACSVGTQNGCSSNAWCKISGGLPTCLSGQQQPGEPCNDAANGSLDCAGGGHYDATTNLCCIGAGQCCNNAATDCPPHADCNPSGCQSGVTYSCAANICIANPISCNGTKRIDCTAQLTTNCGNPNHGPPDCGAHLAPPCPEACPTPCQYGDACSSPSPLGCQGDSDCEASYFCLPLAGFTGCYTASSGFWGNICLAKHPRGPDLLNNCCDIDDECLNATCSIECGSATAKCCN